MYSLVNLLLTSSTTAIVYLSTQRKTRSKIWRARFNCSSDSVAVNISAQLSFLDTRFAPQFGSGVSNVRSTSCRSSHANGGDLSDISHSYLAQHHTVTPNPLACEDNDTENKPHHLYDHLYVLTFSKSLPYRLRLACIKKYRLRVRVRLVYDALAHEISPA